MKDKKLPEFKINQVKDTVSTTLRLARLVWQIDKGLFSGSIVATILPGIIPFINVYIYKLIIDLVVASVGGIQTFDYSQLYLLIGFRVLTYFLQEVAFRTQEYVEKLLWTKVPIQINQMLLGKIANLDAEYFEDSSFRDLLERVRDTYNYRPQNLISHLLFGLQSLVQVSIAFVAIANLNFLLVFLVALVAVPEFILQTQQSKFAWNIWGWHSPLRKRFWYLAELLQSRESIKELKIFKLARTFLGEIKSIQEKFYKDNRKLARQNYFLTVTFNIFGTGLFVGVELYVIFQTLASKLTVGDIGFYTGVVSNFQNGLGGLLRNVNQLFESALYVKSIFEVLDAKPHLATVQNPVVLSIKHVPKIEFKNVDFAYPGTKAKILKNFSLTINPKEKIAFVGENGAGKSTIIKLLARFYDVDRGQILVDGVDIAELDISSWYKHLGILFQDFNQYEHKVLENIHFGDIEKDAELGKIREAAKFGGADEVVERLEHGYEQMLGRTFEGGVELSVGQWQKIALSRAFFRNAPIFILDEPTASIDAKAEAEIFDKVEKLARDKTLIIISHRFSTVRNAQKIYVLENGAITESGSHEALMKKNGQYASLFKLQAKGYQ